jgi:hypothetical protein
MSSGEEGARAALGEVQVHAPAPRSPARSPAGKGAPPAKSPGKSPLGARSVAPGGSVVTFGAWNGSAFTEPGGMRPEARTAPTTHAGAPQRLLQDADRMRGQARDWDSGCCRMRTA